MHLTFDDSPTASSLLMCTILWRLTDFNYIDGQNEIPVYGTFELIALSSPAVYTTHDAHNSLDSTNSLEESGLGDWRKET